MKRIAIAALTSAVIALGAFTGCSSAAGSGADEASSTSMALEVVDGSVADTSAPITTASASTTENAPTTTVSSAAGGILDTADLFTDRDLKQAADTANAKAITLTSGEDVTISEEGVYVISGTAEDATIMVNADSAAKVQLVLGGVSITNSDAPAIYVESADKVFITTAEGSTNALATTGEFAAIGDDDGVDGVIFARDDIVLNGMGTLALESSDNGIVGKDDVKVTGGFYEITASGHGIEGKDSVAIADGTFTITAGTDAIHAENSDDPSLGYTYIAGGAFTIAAGSDGIAGNAVVQIDGGAFTIDAAEGIEGTYVQINEGTVNITATDDGINATPKSSAYNVVLEINGGDVVVDMGAGDTDALDSNGNLIINGGTVNITAQFAFDFDGVGQLNGGTVIVNGEQVTEITNSMMMGGAGGAGGPMGGGAGGQQSSMGSPDGMR